MVDQTQRESFVAALRNLGGSAGNVSLREVLEWDEATYSAVKEDQIRAGVVTPGRGRGGSVALTAAQRQMQVEKLPGQGIPNDRSAPSKRAKANGNGGDLGFEAELFKAADKLRGIWSRPTTSTLRSA
jgi:type I restriction enzyme M protein